MMNSNCHAQDRTVTRASHIGNIRSHVPERVSSIPWSCSSFPLTARAPDSPRSCSMSKTGLPALLRPEDSIVVLIDHQPYQFANLHSHEPTMVANNVIGLAKGAKVFNVPTILTTVIEERGGYLIKGLQDVFPDQKPIDRTFINTWQDERVVQAVKKTGRKQ